MISASERKQSEGAATAAIAPHARRRCEAVLAKYSEAQEDRERRRERGADASADVSKRARCGKHDLATTIDRERISRPQGLPRCVAAPVERPQPHEGGSSATVASFDRLAPTCRCSSRADSRYYDVKAPALYPLEQVPWDTLLIRPAVPKLLRLLWRRKADRWHTITEGIASKGPWQ